MSLLVAERAETLRERLPGAVATIGNFDGVHRGHQEILARVRRRAAAIGGPGVVVTFEPHPLQVLAPERAPRMIGTRDQKLRWFEEAGLDAVLMLRFDARLAAVGARDFVTGCLSRDLGARAVYVGANFNFGRGREGNAALLVRFCREVGIEAETVPEVLFLGSPISSSRIRRALQSGEVELARELLGRPFSLLGTVGPGAGRGAALGFPTANLSPDNDLLPQDGVYVTRAASDGRTWRSVTNIGSRPTFEGQDFAVETHLLDESVDLYGRRLEVAFLARLRPELRFDSPRALIEQVGRDVARAREYFRAGRDA